MTAAMVLIVVFAAPWSSAGPADLPNLRPTDEVYLWVDRMPENFSQDGLYIGAVIENAGSMPLELRALVPGRERDAQQCVAWRARICSTWAPAGRMIDNLANLEQCWSVENVVRYEIRRLDATGEPVAGPEGLALEAWNSMPLQDDDVYYGDYPPPEFFAAPPTYPSCVGAQRQGISPGFYTYFSGEWWGQQIPLADVPNGLYALSITIDPQSVIQESDDADNTHRIDIALSGLAGSRSVEVQP